jgi:hypothetical protein
MLVSLRAADVTSPTTPAAGLTAAELLARADRAGLKVEADGERLRVRGPREHQDLGQELVRRKVEVLAALAGAHPQGLRSVGTAPCRTAWDAAGAVVSECDKIVAAGLPALSAPQRNVAEVYLGLVRRYAERRDELLWTMPDFLRGELIRWQGSRSVRRPAYPTAKATT